MSALNTLRAIQEGLTARGAVLQELPENASEIEVKALAVAESHRLWLLIRALREQSRGWEFVPPVERVLEAAA